MSDGVSSEPDLSGTTLGPYRLLRRLGHGGMGAVYEAQHELLDRHAAVKVLAQRLANNEIARKRFLREARAASRIQHPNVIEIYDVGFAGDQVYFVMELLQGQDLGDLLRVQPRLPWPRARPILLPVVAALQAAHEAGVIHRDIKPANCFLVDVPGAEPRVKVLDFGIAKVAVDVDNPTTELTTTGEVFGTVGYLPPETANGVSKDPRSDLYAVGVMMFRMLTGRLPFEGSALEVMAQHIGREPPSPRALEPAVPAGLERIILKCLEKQPEDRYASMRELELALRAVDDPQARPAPARPTPGQTAPGHPPVSMSQAELIDLDQRPMSRRLPAAAPLHAAARDPTVSDGREPPEPPELPPMPTDEPPLSLDVPEGWRPGDPVGGAPPVPPHRGPSVRVLVGVGVVAALGIGLWSLRERLAGSPAEMLEDIAEGTEPAVAPTVKLHVETVPEDAKVLVDGQLHPERPISVPRSEDYLRVRVEAEGYQPRAIQVQPLVDRRLELKLKRARKPKRR